MFDFRLTTHANLGRIKGMRIDFLTLRRHSSSLLHAVDFFYMDALSAAVPMKIELDLQLTLMASGLNRLLAMRIGSGKQTAKSRTLFRNIIMELADITIANDGVDVRIGPRANNPFLLNASCDETEIAVPWLNGRRLRTGFLRDRPARITSIAAVGNRG